MISKCIHVEVLAFAPNILEVYSTTCITSAVTPAQVVNPTRQCIVFPITYYLTEPEVLTKSEVNQSKPEKIVNSDSSVANIGRTFDIDLPLVTMKNGPFR